MGAVAKALKRDVAVHTRILGKMMRNRPHHLAPCTHPSDSLLTTTVTSGFLPISSTAT